MTPNARSITLAYLCAVLNACIIGFSYSSTKYAVEGLGSFDTLAWRFGIAFLVYSIFLSILGKIPKITFRAIVRLAPLALFYPLGFFTFQSCGLLYISSIEAGIMSACAPVLTALLAAFFIREKTGFKQYIAIAVSVFGVIYISLHKTDTGMDLFEKHHLLGLFLILLSCFATAGYTIINRVLIRSFEASEISFILMLVGAVVFIPIAFGYHCIEGTQAEFFRPVFEPEFLLPIAYLSLFASLLTSYLASVVLKQLPSSRLSVFLNLSTVVSIFAGYFFLHEEIRYYHVLGTTLILLGVFGTNFFASERGTQVTAPKRG